MPVEIEGMLECSWGPKLYNAVYAGVFSLCSSACTNDTPDTLNQDDMLEDELWDISDDEQQQSKPL